MKNLLVELVRILRFKKCLYILPNLSGLRFLLFYSNNNTKFMYFYVVHVAWRIVTIFECKQSQLRLMWNGIMFFSLLCLLGIILCHLLPKWPFQFLEIYVLCCIYVSNEAPPYQLSIKEFPIWLLNIFFGNLWNGYLKSNFVHRINTLKTLRVA